MHDSRTRAENIQGKPTASYFVRKQESTGKQQQSCRTSKGHRNQLTAFPMAKSGIIWVRKGSITGL